MSLLLWIPVAGVIIGAILGFASGWQELDNDDSTDEEC